MRKSLVVTTILALLILLAAMPAQTQGTGRLSDKMICLDPGHGGSDPGAIYNDGMIYLEEADINLDVAYALKALLEADGAEVVMTRPDDSDNTNSDRYTFANKEEADILVSIHTNSVLRNPDTVDGSMALYFHDDDKVLAQTIYAVMSPYLRDMRPAGVVTFTEWGVRKFASGVLMKSDMPAAIMEPLCMSHPAEAALLVTPVYLDNGTTANPDCNDCRRAQIAQAIYQGIVSYDFSQGDDDGGRPCDEPPCGKEKTR